MFNVQHFWPPPTVKLFWLFKLKEVKVYSLFHAKFNLLTACGSLSLSATSLCPLQLHMHHLAYSLPLSLSPHVPLSHCMCHLAVSLSPHTSHHHAPCHHMCHLTMPSSLH